MSPTARRTRLSLSTFGYHRISPNHLARKLEAGRERELVFEPGNFVLAITEGDTTYIISSLFGAINYFYSVYAGRLWHGPTVLSVLEASGQPWAWNWEVLGDVICLQHSLGDATLHPNVFRVPPATVLRFARGRLTTANVAQPEQLRAEAASPERALEAFVDELQLWLGDEVILSASGGLDSRLLLAGCLALGRRPQLVVMGSAAATDRQIVHHLADRLQLPLHPVELSIQDYHTHARHITCLTNGTNSAHHWHTYLYPRLAGLTKDQHFLIGTNGEFARTFYLNLGIAARIIDHLPRTSLLLHWYLRDKARRTFRAREVARFAPGFGGVFRLPGQWTRWQRFTGRGSGRGILTKLDTFYLRERLQNFLGNGIAMYNDTTTALMPLLSERWVAQVAGLPRRWRLGDNWHRFAIARLCPQLLDAPEAGVAATTPPRAPPLYWRPGRKYRRSLVPYAPYQRLFRDPATLALLRARAHLFDDVMERSVLLDILDEQARAGTRDDALAHLFMMAFWLERIRELDTRAGAPAAPALRTSTPKRDL